VTRTETPKRKYIRQIYTLTDRIVNNTVYFLDQKMGWGTSVAVRGEIKKEKKEEELGKVNQTENKRSK